MHTIMVRATFLFAILMVCSGLEFQQRLSETMDAGFQLGQQGRKMSTVKLPDGAAVHIDGSSGGAAADLSDNQWTLSGQVPTEATAMINSWPAYDLDQKCLSIDSVPQGTEATVFVVNVVKNNINYWACQFWHGEHNQDFGLERYERTGELQLQSYDVSGEPAIGYNIDKPTVWSGRTNFADGRCLWKTTDVNGVQTKESECVTQGSSGGRPSGGDKKVSIGCTVSGSALFNGYLGELLYYSRSLSDEEMQEVTDYLYAKWMEGVILRDPTAAPTVAPTPTPPTPVAPYLQASQASAKGDPHLTNINGQRFDLVRAGRHVLIHIPKGAEPPRVFLRVVADVLRLGVQCGETYFSDINITGTWVEGKHNGSLQFHANDVGGKEESTWMMFGAVELKVVHGRHRGGIHYLNIYAKHLGRTQFAVGGLLGEDDHEYEATPDEGCVSKINLNAMLPEDPLL